MSRVVTVDENMADAGVRLIDEVFKRPNRRTLVRLLAKGNNKFLNSYDDADAKAAEAFFEKFAGQSRDSKYYSDDVVAGAWVCVLEAMRALAVEIHGEFELGKIHERALELACGKSWHRGFPRHLPMWLEQR